VARAIVRQATRQSYDVDSLREVVAGHIDNPRDREAFVSGTQKLGSASRAPGGGTNAPGTAANAAVRTAGATATSQPGPAATAGALPPTLADDHLSEAAIAAAAPLLAEVLGPIAKLLVKKAAAQAQGRAQFLQMLVAAAEPADRARIGQLLARLPR
jgi:serine/threonine-protein kinase